MPSPRSAFPSIESLSPAVVNVLGVPIDRVDYAQVAAQIADWIEAAGTAQAIGAPAPPARQICTVNPEFLVDATRMPAFRDALLHADLRMADGVGVAWAASLLGAPVPERVTGSDGIYYFSEEAARHGWRVYFLGAAAGIAEATAALMMARYPGLQVAGTFSGSPGADEWPEIEQRLWVARPDILFVAFGHPRQDLWIAAHRNDLASCVAMGVGGAFDYAVGLAPRAPALVRRLGLEWLHRLATQPWRWRRMLKLPQFVLLVLRQRFIRT